MNAQLFHYCFTYKIGIGVDGNNSTTIEGMFPNGIKRSIPSYGVLSCNEVRDFWISWSNGIVKVGEGRNVGENSLLSYDDLTFYPVKAFTFKSPGANGTWEFPEYEGKHLISPECHTANVVLKRLKPLT